MNTKALFYPSAPTVILSVSLSLSSVCEIHFHPPRLSISKRGADGRHRFLPWGDVSFNFLSFFPPFPWARKGEKGRRDIPGTQL